MIDWFDIKKFSWHIFEILLFRLRRCQGGERGQGGGEGPYTFANHGGLVKHISKSTCGIYQDPHLLGLLTDRTNLGRKRQKLIWSVFWSVFWSVNVQIPVLKIVQIVHHHYHHHHHQHHHHQTTILTIMFKYILSIVQIFFYVQNLT